MLREKDKWGHVARELARHNVVWTKTRNEPEGIRIHPITPDAYRNVIKCLNHFRYQYHMYTLEKEKRVERGI